MKVFVDVVRWAAVAPAFIAAAFAASFLAGIFNFDLFLFAFPGFCAVLAAAHTAPKGARTVATVSCTLYVLAQVIDIVQLHDKIKIGQLILRGVGIAGPIVAAMSVSESEGAA